MNEDWWERPTCWVCDYGWLLLAVIVLGLAAYFTRPYWLPLLGLQPAPAAAEPGPPVELGTGDIQATLTWDSINDIDLWVTDPAGETIYYGHGSSLSGGELDVDANADCVGMTDNPVENIYWPPGEAPRGEYRVEVQYYRQCSGEAPTPYQVRLLVDGQVQEFRGIAQAQGDQLLVHEFSR